MTRKFSPDVVKQLEKHVGMVIDYRRDVTTKKWIKMEFNVSAFEVTDDGLILEVLCGKDRHKILVRPDKTFELLNHENWQGERIAEAMGGEAIPCYTHANFVIGLIDLITMDGCKEYLSPLFKLPMPSKGDDNQVMQFYVRETNTAHSNNKLMQEDHGVSKNQNDPHHKAN